VGIDPIARGLEFARNKALRSRIPARPLQASAAHLPLADGSMGFSVAIGTLYHLSRMELACALREVRRVLRPGGEANLHFLDIDDWRRSLAPEIRPEEAPVPSYEAVVTCFCSAGTIQQWIEQARLQLLSLELRTSESEAGQQRNWLAHCRR
jgi:SAM-dependent methyltransferase